MNTINNSKAVDVFIFDENPCAQISIKEAIEQLYADRSKETGI